MRAKQIGLMIFLIVCIVLLIRGGLYLRSHPLTFGKFSAPETGPTETYKPYEAVAPARPSVTAAPVTQTATYEREPAGEIERFYTTKKATVFTFSGLGNVAELNGVLDSLRRGNSTATFFITKEEMETLGEQIRLIRAAGHSLGISVSPSDCSNGSELQTMLKEMENKLRLEFTYVGKIFVRPTYGHAPRTLLEAADASGMSVMTQILEAVPGAITRMTDVDEAVSTIIKENDGKFQRGEIVHFQMNMIQHNDYMLGQLVTALIERQCVYPVMSADQVAADIASMYTYPLPDDEILPEVLNKIYPGHLANMTDEEILKVIAKGYVGIDWVNTGSFLPGFVGGDIRMLDKTGLIENDQNYVFLTFDDWGTDGTVDHLLEVLKKHDAKATFFVRTQYVQYNPNLLRAIAKEGHTIGCHSHYHKQLSNEVTATKYEELTDEQVATLPDDYVTSYNTLQHIVGDLRDEDGKPSLSLLFRPPTLAVGKRGLTAVFDCGFTHSVSGFYTTQDYKFESAETLARQIKRNIRSGAILIMHFSDTAKVTADALDQCFMELEREGKAFKFVGLNAVYGNEESK